MPNPQNAWQHAATIGPTGPQKAPPGETKIGMMPWVPPGGLGTILAGLKGWLPGAGEVASGGILGRSRAIPGLVPKRYAPVAETLGEANPEFTAVGGEGMYNAARGRVQRAAEPVEAAYKRVMGTMGPRPSAPPPFQALQQSGAFRGGRSVRDIGNLQQEQPGGLTSALAALRNMR